MYMFVPCLVGRMGMFEILGGVNDDREVIKAQVI